ncbi:MAG: hypothetical protein ACK5O2_16765 [Microthrixaceae bacterium]
MPERGPQGGFGLVESLVSVVLTSMVIIALVGALLAAVRSSEAADRVQRADSAIGSFTESIKSMPYPTSAGGCPSLSDVRTGWANYPDAWSPPPGITIEIEQIAHWQPTGADAGSYAATCPPGGDPSAHLLTVSVSSKGRTRLAEVVMADR